MKKSIIAVAIIVAIPSMVPTPVRAANAGQDYFDSLQGNQWPLSGEEEVCISGDF